ncbi:AraC family transcriptional regulator [Salinispirillum sp. LH 10-3-1]|uniref:AraC family transcriptional regulator n=1 Tax=Salinispirillum sp. LH 10-3-1 TaxID=2952525 RepID=A0AB38YCZ3_9GAMM
MAVTTEPSVNSPSVRPLLDHLQQRGIAPETLYNPDLVTQIRQRNEHIPIRIWYEMFTQAIAATNDPDLPLVLGEQAQPAQFGILGFAAMSATTVRDVIDILKRYETLIDEVNETAVVQNGEFVELHWLPIATTPNKCFMQLSLSSWLSILRQITGCTVRAEAHFNFAPPAQLDKYYQLFDQVQFNTPVTKLRLAASALDLPILYSDPDTYRFLLNKAESELRASNEPAWLKQLKNQIRNQLPTGRSRLEDIAEQLEIAPRSLQHRLSRLNLTYRQVLDDVRLEQAERYLCSTELSIVDISFLLGYAEQSAFNHAFKRWKATSPHTFRAESQAGRK